METKEEGHVTAIENSCILVETGSGVKVIDLSFLPFNAVVGDSVAITTIKEKSAVVIKIEPSSNRIVIKRKAPVATNAVCSANEMAATTSDDTEPLSLRLEELMVPRDNYFIPQEFIDAFSLPIELQVREALNQLVPEKLHFENYGQFFHGSLWMEEFHAHTEFLKYNSERVKFQLRGDRYEDGAKKFFLKIPHVFEKRPAMNVGNPVTIKSRSIETNVFKGYVTDVERDGICIRFSRTFGGVFENSPDEEYGVKFTFLRTAYKRLHMAVDMASVFTKEFLFPEKIVEKNVQLDVMLNEGLDLIKVSTGEKIPWFNDKLNVNQKRAVTAILRAESTLPFIVNSGPGTGKTLTVIEAVRQLVKLVKNSRILITAATNVSADHIAECLSVFYKSSKLLRLVSHTVITSNAVPEVISEYTRSSSQLGGDNTRQSARKWERLNDFRIVVSTCCCIGEMLGKSDFRFTHVVIDEAANGTETETLIPINLCEPGSQVIMTGDIKQLPPVAFSKYAKHRLDKSMLDRLLTCYATFPTMPEKTVDDRLQVKLLHNYRNLPTILNSFNERFYNSELIGMVSGANSKDAKFLDYLVNERHIFGGMYKPKKGFGIFFVDTPGANKTLAGSTSYLNLEEIVKIKLFLHLLIDKRGVAPRDVGIITVYSLQKYFLEFNLDKYEDLKIGSVEEFQGKERKVICVSTVRTSRMDNLKFLASPQRVNVILSRARSMVAIFGELPVIQHCGPWKSIIEECKKNDTLVMLHDYRQ